MAFCEIGLSVQIRTNILIPGVFDSREINKGDKKSLPRDLSESREDAMGQGSHYPQRDDERVPLVTNTVLGKVSMIVYRIHPGYGYRFLI